MKIGSSEGNPRHHAANIRRMLTEVIDHVREDVGKVAEPKMQVLLETTAEVLIGLRTAYDHYESKAEPAMA